MSAFGVLSLVAALGCDDGSRQRQVLDLAASTASVCAVVNIEEADAGMDGDSGAGADAGADPSDAASPNPDAGVSPTSSGGLLYCWGDGQSTARQAPEYRLEADQVSLGAPSCVVAGGQVQCWGEGSRGELGDGARSDRAFAGPVLSLPAARAVETARFLDDDDDEGDLGGFACAITEAQELYCWGAGDRGQLGNQRTADHASPQRVSAPVGFGTEGLSEVNAVALGRDFACAVASTSVFCWGQGDRYQLGTTDGTRAQPGDVLGELASLRVAPVIAAGQAHACILDIQGDTYCWGANEAGQLGQGTISERRLPSQVQGLPMDFLGQELAAGADHTCVRGFDRRLFCWGANGEGQLGSRASASSPRPVFVASGVDAMALGDGFTCFESQGAVRCVGAGDEGQLGNGTTQSSRVPVPVAGL